MHNQHCVLLSILDSTSISIKKYLTKLIRFLQFQMKRSPTFCFSYLLRMQSASGSQSISPASQAISDPAYEMCSVTGLKLINVVGKEYQWKLHGQCGDQCQQSYSHCSVSLQLLRNLKHQFAWADMGRNLSKSSRTVQKALTAACWSKS